MGSELKRISKELSFQYKKRLYWNEEEMDLTANPTAKKLPEWKEFILADSAIYIIALILRTHRDMSEEESIVVARSLVDFD